MLSVVFLKTTSTGQEAVGHALLRKGRVVLDVPDGMRETIETVVVACRRLTPVDGEDYLRALPVAFSGSYFRARLDETS